MRWSERRSATSWTKRVGPQFQEALDGCAELGTPSRTELTLAGGPGSAVPVSVSLRAFDVYGTPTLSMTVVDLTEHKRLARAEATREAGESYRLAIRATHDAVWDLDLVTGRFQTNESEQKLLGVPPAGGRASTGGATTCIPRTATAFGPAS